MLASAFRSRCPCRLGRRWLCSYESSDAKTPGSKLNNATEEVPKRRMSSYEGDGKTTVALLNKPTEEVPKDERGRLLVEGISQLGFSLNNGTVVLGSMAVFPRTILSWNVPSLEDLTEESLSLFTMLEPKLDLLVLGTGDMKSRCPPHLLRFLIENGLSVEAQPTEQACCTFNFLNDEKRWVAAALIVPTHVVPNEDDYFRAFRARRQLHREDEDSPPTFLELMSSNKYMEALQNNKLLSGELSPAKIRERVRQKKLEKEKEQQLLLDEMMKDEVKPDEMKSQEIKPSAKDVQKNPSDEDGGKR
ncbi:unnamed protein product [Cyprideis torosa]|uniref:NADH dehydrogenase [ubiquinone] 1 alpha subcomplex assembly factor 3 n=1 Tax=Cyprideis torosa TaxID=163714 RepID=A0A7R8W2F8_9CRUS|nr:unnamed protein product [Cyprideis torosa]CAG0881822.1 unnamed protein product [Cyprideis torosa]